MKYIFLLTILFVSAAGLQSQKINVTKGNLQKNKKFVAVQGTFTIGGKPFIIVGESRHMVVDQSAVFYPVEDDMSLGEVIRQEDINIIDGAMELEKCLYIEKIIISNGKTFLFYTKRDGKNGKVYFIELEEDCQIDPEKATEVMELNGLGFLDKNTNFAVRQSPDGSKIFLVGMVKKSAGSANYFFKVYSSEMKSLIWEKTFSARPIEASYFSGTDNFSTGKDHNNMLYNCFLVNNEGRVFALLNRTNPSETKSELSLISADPKGNLQPETDIKVPGNWIGSNFFRLNNNGEANLFLFYSPDDPKNVVTVMGVDPINTNALLIVGYDGANLKVLSNYEFTNEDQSKFYPSKNRKPNTEYKIGGFTLTNIVSPSSDEVVLVMEKLTAAVGLEKAVPDKTNGYICIIVLDSEFKIKYMYSFTRIFNSRNYGGGYMCTASILNGNLNLFYVNEQEQFQLVQFTNLQTFKLNNLGAKYPVSEGYPVLNTSMILDGNILLPTVNNKEIGMSSIILK